MSFSIERIARLSKAAIDSSVVDDLIVLKAAEPSCDVYALLRSISSEARDRIKIRVTNRPKCVSEVVLGIGACFDTEDETARWYEQRMQAEFEGLRRLADAFGMT